MAKRPYIPAQFDSAHLTRAYLLGWNDGRELREAGYSAKEVFSTSEKHAYEVGFDDFHRKNPQAGGGK